MASIRSLFSPALFDWYQGTLRIGGISEDGAVLSGDADAFVRDLLMSFKCVLDAKAALRVVALEETSDDYTSKNFRSGQEPSKASDDFQKMITVYKSGQLLDVESCAPNVSQYHYGLEITLNRQRLVHLCYGGNGGGIHFISSGANADVFYGWLRNSPYFGFYSITRADVRVDLIDYAAWEYAYKTGVKIAKAHKVKTEVAGDWLAGENGRTLYIGSRTSFARARIYEKGIKEGGDRNHVRIEAQIRPPKLADKIGAAALSAEEMLGVCPWVFALFSTLLNETGSKNIIPSMSPVYSANKKSLDFKLRSLVKQYGKTLTAAADEVGGWEALGEHLKAVIDDIQNSGRTTYGSFFDSVSKEDIEAFISKIS